MPRKSRTFAHSNQVGTIEVKGAPELIAKFERMGVNCSDQLEAIVREGATMVERDADRMAPTRTSSRTR